MLNIKPPEYLFCPLCGTELSIKKDIDDEKRKMCPKCDWIYYPHVSTTSCGIIIRKGRVLLVKRAREPYKNKWMFPAGFVQYGEHPKEALVREVKEETNLAVKNPKLIAILQSTEDPRAPGHFMFFYKVEAKGILKSNDWVENSDIGWFDINNPPKIGWRSHKLMLKKLQEKSI
ncbi:hypothetical protein A2115_01220 [Candidatus Woesebacteria bacterium GWA1_41_8]|jgi:ADP-ribose pyrophosphatase YjhB (NUDIX family)|uniref:Nudix hydrolase domain-containing protein n=1 Tax=Candidatus Woesebacteria bacterium GWA1_41_8 TaxID=1802471 RepID=A0A1F7WIG8_9BACT|nr:MAG: hypothetical protein A2115_01220 [Candidatus Woesebacteria bacterium GWA1_41_8]